MWEDPDPVNNESATVTLQVTRPNDVTYRWEYTVTNDSLTSKFASPGLGQFQVTPNSTAVIDAKSLGTDMKGWNISLDSGAVTWWEPCLTDGPYIEIDGPDGTFWFNTPAVPITAATGSVSPAGMSGSGGGGGGSTAAALAGGDDEEPTPASLGGPVNCVLLEPFAQGAAKGPAPVPTVALTVPADVIVKANNDNMSPWSPRGRKASPRSGTSTSSARPSTSTRN